MARNKTPNINLSSLSDQWALPDHIKSSIKGAIPFYGAYLAAIREMSTRLEILDDEFQLAGIRNPIHTIQTRLKTPESIQEKLQRKGYSLSYANIAEHVQDIAGIRVICSYLEDVYEVAELIRRQDDVRIIREADYIAAPKQNGYRSFHMVIAVPIFFSKEKRQIPVEVQIRSIAMDFWASLEHDLRYKNGGEVDPVVAAELFDCGEAIAAIDLRMQKIARTINSTETPEGAKGAAEALYRKMYTSDPTLKPGEKL